MSLGRRQSNLRHALTKSYQREQTLNDTQNFWLYYIIYGIYHNYVKGYLSHESRQIGFGKLWHLTSKIFNGFI